MNTELPARRWRMTATGVALAMLASVYLAGSDGLSGGVGVARAAETDDAPAEESEPSAEDTPAQSEQAGTDSASENTPDDSDADDSEEEDSDEDESEEIFVPSEDISEDIDVPFPVDI